MFAEQQSACQKAAYFLKVINNEKSRVYYWKEIFVCLGARQMQQFYCKCTGNSSCTLNVFFLSFRKTRCALPNLQQQLRRIDLHSRRVSSSWTRLVSLKFVVFQNQRGKHNLGGKVHYIQKTSKWSWQEREEVFNAILMQTFNFGLYPYAKNMIFQCHTPSSHIKKAGLLKNLGCLFLLLAEILLPVL